jgi:hypothetical protein
LNGAQARYLLVDGYAVAFHAQPRFTKDLDIWADADPANAKLVLEALRAFGAPLGQLEHSDLASPGTVFQMGVPPNRIDIMTTIDGLLFSEAWADRVAMMYGDQAVPVIGRVQLIRNKRASGRPQDLLDLEMLKGDP